MSIGTVERRLGRLEAIYEAETVKHARGRSLEELRRYEGRVLDFFRDVLGTEPWEGKQAEAALAADQDRQVVILGCHGAGKEWLIGRLALYYAYARGMLVILTSATDRQVLGQTFRELRKAFQAAPDLPGDALSREVRIGKEPRIIAMSYGSDIDRLTGWHDPEGVAVLISEGQGSEPEGGALDAAMACTTDSRSRILVAGNPVRPSGTLYAIHARPTWRMIRISAFDHPNVREGREVVPGGPSPDYPRRMAAEYGEGSAFYVGRVLAEFPGAGSIDSLLRLEWIEAAFARGDAADPALQRSPLPLLALDVARSLDRDENVCAIVQGTRVHSLHPWRSRDLVDTADRFLALADATSKRWHDDGGRKGAPGYYPDLRLVVDTPGVGGGVVDTCRHEPRNRRVEEWWGWKPAPDGRRYSNIRAASHWHLRKLMQSGEAVLPRDEKLKEDLLALEWTEDSAGRIQMLSKDDLRKVLGRSPDRSDPVVMGLYSASGAARPGTFVFEV